MKFSLGDRARISLEYNWAQGALATIVEPPEAIRQLVEDQAPWYGLHRFVAGRKGPIEFYFVKFDGPQMDADGDGPYSQAEIEADRLELD